MHEVQAGGPVGTSAVASFSLSVSLKSILSHLFAPCIQFVAALLVPRGDHQRASQMQSLRDKYLPGAPIPCCPNPMCTPPHGNGEARNNKNKRRKRTKLTKKEDDNNDKQEEDDDEEEEEEEDDDDENDHDS